LSNDQKALFEKKLSEIENAVRILGAFSPIRYNHPSLNALNDISIATMTMQAELERVESNG